MLNTVLFALALPALLSHPSFVLSQPHFLAEFGDFTPVGAVGDYPLDVLSKDKDTIDDKVVNNSHSVESLTNVAMRLGAGKDGVVLSSLFSAGGDRTCAQEYEGPFYCWGNNQYGGLGDGTTVNKYIPTLTKLGDEQIVVQVSASYYHTCVINNSGALFCMGLNRYGELGDGTTVNKHIPTLIKLGDDSIAVQVAAGACHTCVINDSGTFYCWGENEYGRLGDGTTVNRHTPTLIKLVDDSIVKQVAAGYYHTCVINDSGALFCMGLNSSGQLGDGTLVNKHIPTLIKLGDDSIVVQVATGAFHTCAINDSGAFYSWGSNGQGQLGDATTVGRAVVVPTLIKLGDESTVVQVSAGFYHTCVINNSGALFCMGYNHYGELGDGTTVNKYIPTLIQLGDDSIVKQVSAGEYHTCVLKDLKDTGGLICWGYGGYGQLGDNFRNNKLTAANVNVIMKIQDQTSKTPTVKPTKQNSDKPSLVTSDQPSKIPTVKPTKQNSDKPSLVTSDQPSKIPTVKPTKQNSEKPSSEPSYKPYKLRLSACSV